MLYLKCPYIVFTYCFFRKKWVETVSSGKEKIWKPSIEKAALRKKIQNFV